jgi:putative redox protein
MAILTLRLLGDGDCHVDHAATGATVQTSKSPDFGGRGTSFSSTDLLAAALATCIATDIEPVAVRNGIALDRIHIEADKQISTSPKRIVELIVRVHISGTPDDVTLLKLQRAAETCLVQRSLHPDVKCDVEVASAP